MHVLFVEPFFPAGQRQFVRALHAVGAKVTGIGEAPVESLGHELRSHMHAYERVRSVVDEDALYAAVRRVQQREWVDRLEATIEAHILPTARVRERANIPGLSVMAAILCRDKPQMKEFLRRHGIPSAQSIGTSSVEEACAFANRVGYPLILKPRAGAGASGTMRVDNREQLDAGLSSMGVGRGASIAIEEFITGHEGFYDTLTVNGTIEFEFISHYYPNVLEGMRNRWISPQIVVTNRVDAPGYRELKQLGKRVVDAFELETTATHMEWFFGPKGLKFSEIGARPPGVSHWDLYCAANEINLYREWAHAIVHRRISRPLSRRFSAGIVALRPETDGRIRGYDGVEVLQAQYGRWVVDINLPPVGTPTQPIEAGYMANAWVRLRHPDYDVLRHMLDNVGRTLRVRAG